MRQSILQFNCLKDGTAPFEIDECSQMRKHTCTHKTSHRPHARPITPHHSDTRKAFNPMDAGTVGRSWWAVRTPVSAIDPHSEGKGEAYPLRQSGSVACLLLAADGAERTWGLGGDRRRREEDLRETDGRKQVTTFPPLTREGEINKERARRKIFKEAVRTGMN